MRILFDTNVWRYIVDVGAEKEVRTLSRRNCRKIVVAPSTAYETLRLPDIQLRDRIIALIADDAWVRLMPEAFSESEELKKEIRRLRPEWLRANPELVLYRQLRFDWMRRTGGFWSRLEKNAQKELDALGLLGDQETLERARNEAYESRKFTSGVSQREAHVGLNKIFGRPMTLLPGWRGDDVEFWRLSSRRVFQHVFEEALFYGTSSAYLDWLGGEVDAISVLADPASFSRFWLYEANIQTLPRFWLRGAFEFLQSFHKVTDGTPCDSQLATYLLEADFIVSADKNFVRFVNRCRDEGPFHIAQGKLISGGALGVEELLNFLAMKSK